MKNNEIEIIVGKNVVRVNVFEDYVMVKKKGIRKLNMELEEKYIYKEEKIMIIESDSGF
jgi:hypothetical protein